MNVPTKLGWTYEDYKRLPANDLRHELLEGYLVKEPSPATIHQVLVTRLIQHLAEQLPHQDRNYILPAPVGVILAANTVLQPDVLYLSKGRRYRLQEDAVHGAPDLVIEILSPSTRERDLTTKRELYGRYNAVEYWIIDPESRGVIVCSDARDGRFQQVQEFWRPKTVESSTGLRLDLTKLFTEY